MHLTFAAVLLLLLSAPCVHAADKASTLELNRTFSDHMVLQRDKALKIWGAAKEGEPIVVTFAAQTETTTADKDGRWVVTLKPMKANASPQVLKIKSPKVSIALHNILVGDVFLFARQSAIDVSLGSTPKGKKAVAGLAANKAYRFIRIKADPSRTPLDNLKQDATKGWQVVDKQSALAMSASSFYLGRDLIKEANVPIGIVDLDMGYHFPGAWLSKDGVELALKRPGDGVGDLKSELEHMPKDYEAWDKQIEGYVRGKAWRGKASEKPLLGFSPIEMAHSPSVCHNGVIHPLRGLVVKGLLLQLGNNYPMLAFTRLRRLGKIADWEALKKANAQSYLVLKMGTRMTPHVLPVAPDDLRRSLGDDSLPVAWIMPPGSDLYQYATQNREVRELQRRAQAESKAIDLILPGTEHIRFSGQPADEPLLSDRCKQWVLGTLYATKGPASGPLFERFEFKDKVGKIVFKAGTAVGLSAKDDALKHFEVAGEDGVFSPCSARIDGTTIKLTCDEVPQMAHVRYSWSHKPAQGLVNSAGLPAVPFNTDPEWAYNWWPDAAPIVLPEEYHTPANKWPDRDIAIINCNTEAKGLHLGPTGIWGAPSGPNLFVDKITPGSPADGKVFAGDMIYGVNGTEFGPEPDDKYNQFAAGITRAESEADGGKMIVNVRRKGKLIAVPIMLEVMGSYSATSPWDCEKSQRIIEKAEAWMRNGLRPRTGVPQSDTYAYGPWNANILFLLASGNPELQGLVRRYVRQKLDERFITQESDRNGSRDRRHNISVPAERGGIGWNEGYLSMLLGEYYHRTGDPTVLPYLEWMVDMFALGQTQPPDGNPYKNVLAVSDEQVGSFRGGRRTPGTEMMGQPKPPTWRTDYGLMPACEMPGVMGLIHAKQAGLKVDDFVLGRALRHLNYKRAEHGFVLYGYFGLRIDAPAPIDPANRAQGLVNSMNGKLGTAAALFNLLDGYDKAVTNCSERCVYAFNKTRKGHGGAWFNNYWTPIGAYHGGKEKYQHFMKGQQWWRELYRDHTGAVWQAHNAKGKTSVLGVGFVAHRVAHHKRLRMYGAPRSAFGPNPPAYLKPALAAHRKRDYALAEKLVQKELADRKISTSELPRVHHFLDSVQTVSKSVEYDLAYTEDALKRGEYYLATLELPQLKMVIAPENARLKAIAATLESEEGEAKIAATVKQAQEEERRIKAEIAAREAAKPKGKTWEEQLASIVTLAKDGQGYSGGRRKSYQRYPEDQVNRWRLKVLETPSHAPEGWYEPEYDDSHWDQVTLPTAWSPAHVGLLRTTFDVEDVSAYESLQIRAQLYKQHSFRVYLNGHLVAKVNNIPNPPISFPLTPYAMGLLKNGSNTLAVSSEHGKRWVEFTMRLEGRRKNDAKTDK